VTSHIWEDWSIDKGESFLSWRSSVPLLLSSGTVVIAIIDVYKEVSALNPVDVLNHEKRGVACEFQWTIHYLIEAHSRSYVEFGTGPGRLPKIVNMIQIYFSSKMRACILI
jgi:hypothetical protein